MIIKASAKSLIHSPRKLAEVVALVRRRTLEDALIILNHTPRRAAGAVTKLLKSAQANARHNHNLKPDSLLIETIFVTPATRLKRGRVAARLRFQPRQLKRAHLFLSLSGQERPRPKAKATVKSGSK